MKNKTIYLYNYLLDFFIDIKIFSELEIGYILIDLN